MGMNVYINHPIPVEEVKKLFSKKTLKSFDEIWNTVIGMKGDFRAINSYSHKLEFEAVKKHFPNCVFSTLYEDFDTAKILQRMELEQYKLVTSENEMQYWIDDYPGRVGLSWHTLDNGSFGVGWTDENGKVIAFIPESEVPILKTELKTILARKKDIQRKGATHQFYDDKMWGNAFLFTMDEVIAFGKKYFHKPRTKGYTIPSSVAKNEDGTVDLVFSGVSTEYEMTATERKRYFQENVIQEFAGNEGIAYISFD